MLDVIEISYTGDILAHRRCPRAWSYERQAGFHPYEQVQAMEGRLIHHAMEWLTKKFIETKKHASRAEVEERLSLYFKVLWARGFRTTFESKKDIVDRVVGNLYGTSGPKLVVKAVVEGAQHSEYELKTVKSLIKAEFGGKSKVLLTGVLDVVIQQAHPLLYAQVWKWSDVEALDGIVSDESHSATPGDLEIWDYKGTKANTQYTRDYVRQLLTYAALYREKSGMLAKRCVLYFVNEVSDSKRLLAVEVNENLVNRALEWTIEQVKHIRGTTLQFQDSPLSVEGGNYEQRSEPLEDRISPELKQQCTACGFRFDCNAYKAFLGDPNHSDIDKKNVRKN